MRLLAVSLILSVLLLPSCASYDMFKSESGGFEPVDVAYKNNDKAQPKIAPGMTKAQVLENWGKPYFIIDNKAVFGTQVWYYDTVVADKSGSYRKGRVQEWKLSFVGNIVTHISTAMWDRTGINSKSQFNPGLVDAVLKQDGLIK